MTTEKRKAYMRAYYVANCARLKAYSRKRGSAVYAYNPEAQRIASLKWRSAQTTEQKRARNRKSHGTPAPTRPEPALCEVCAHPPRKHPGMCADHDHTTGKFRGWLCHSCNVALGMVRDDVNLLLHLAVYLERNK
jgi:Recombination endonuclease VII